MFEDTDLADLIEPNELSDAELQSPAYLLHTVGCFIPS